MVVSNCLLEQLENAGVKVDVDSYDPEIAKSIPFTPHDATSNQALIGLRVLDPNQKHVVEEALKENPKGSSLDILTVLVSPLRI
jgi:transaldolase